MPEVKLSHPEKVLFPDDGLTKADLAALLRAPWRSGCSRTCATGR